MFTKDSRILNRRLTVPLTSIAKAVGDVFKQTFNQFIKRLFANGEQGFAYDPNDLSTMYQDAAGTVPVTAAGQTVGLVLDKSKGLVLGGELNSNTFNTNLDGWGVGAASSVILENGEAKVTLGGTIFATANNWFKLNGTYALGKRYTVSFDATHVSGGDLQAGFGYAVGLTVTSAQGATKQRYTFTSSGIAATGSGLLTFGTSTAGSVWKIDNVSVKEVMGNHAYQTTSASRPILRQNATTGAYYLEFDGSDDFLRTDNIDFTATDKVSLFVGVRKLSDSIGLVAETGSFGVNTGRGSGTSISFLSKGTVGAEVFTLQGPAPTSSVITAKGDISAPLASAKVNGAGNTNITTQGTGNYGNHPLYIGRRGGTTLPFNGHIYSLIGVGRLTTESEVAAIEKELAKRTGVTLSV